MEETTNEINIIEIIDINFLQNVQDCFAEIFDFAIVIIHNNEWLTQPSKPSAFCNKYARQGELGYKPCEECHRKMEKEAIKAGVTIDYTCHAGLKNFMVPIILEGKYLASVLCGHFLTEQPDENHSKQIAKHLDANEDEYVKEIKKIKILPIEKVNAAKDLIHLVINSIVAISYANFQLKKLGINYRIPKNIALEECFSKPCDVFRRPITNREYEILKLLVSGKSNTEIAKELFISVHTAKAHVSSIIEKFGVEDRVQVAVKAIREGLI